MHTVSAFNLITSVIFSPAPHFFPQNAVAYNGNCQTTPAASPTLQPMRFTWSLGITSRSRWAATTKGPTCQELFLLDGGVGSYGWTNTWFLLEICQKKKQALPKFEVFDCMDIIVALTFNISSTTFKEYIWHCSLWQRSVSVTLHLGKVRSQPYNQAS